MSSDTPVNKPPVTPVNNSSGVSMTINGQLFKEKDIRVVLAAFCSAKGGMPDIDYDKLQVYGGFNTRKTAQNTWGVVKKLIINVNPEGFAAAAEAAKKFSKTTSPQKRSKMETNGEDGAVAPEGEQESPTKKQKTPKKPKTTPKSKATAEEDAEAPAGGDNEAAAAANGSPIKKKATPRKKPSPQKVKAKEVAATHGYDGDKKSADEKNGNAEDVKEGTTESSSVEEQEKTPASDGEAQADTKMDGADE